MPRFSPQRYEQIMTQMLARLVTRAGLSDVSDTSVAKHLCAGVARAIDELYYEASLLLQLFSIDTATGSDLDERAKDIQPATLTRMQAVQSTGDVVFSRSGTTGTVTIPLGTQVVTADGVVFVTTAGGTITPTSAAVVGGHITGQDSALVPVVAQLPGSNGNVVLGTVVKFNSKPTGVDTVTNLAAFSNGQDQESDDAFRTRLKNYVGSLARSTVSALETCVLGAQDPTTSATILFSKVVESTITPGQVTLYIDDGTGSAMSVQAVTGENMCQGLSGPPPNTAVGGETRLFLDNKPIDIGVAVGLTSNRRGTLTQGSQYTLDPTSGLVTFAPALVNGEIITASYTYYTGLIALAQKIVDGDPNNRTAYPGYRAAGIQVTVQAPQIVLTTVNATLTVSDGYDASVVQTAVTGAIMTYINSLPISGDVLRAQLISDIIQTPGVLNVLLSAPAVDVAILDNQLARTQPTNITVS